MTRPLCFAASLMTLAACDGNSSGAVPPSRVVAVTATSDTATADDFCEETFPASNKPFTYPELDGSLSAQASGVRWINVWATWCAPCVEELPRLRAFEEQLQEENISANLVLLNADREVDDFTNFQVSHPETAGSARIKDPDSIPDWAESLGLSRDLTLPIHLLVDSSGHLRCMRASGISEREYGALKAAISQ